MAFLLSPLPWDGVGRFVRKNQLGPVPLHNGKEEKRYAIISHGQSFVPVELRLVGGIARQTRPLSEHPLGGRGLTSLAAAEIQNLSRPSRLTKPLVRDGRKFKEIHWEEALRLLRTKISAAGNSIACVTEHPNSVGAALLRNFLKEQGSNNFFVMPGQQTALKQAFQLLGIDHEPAYDLENSSVTMTIGADWLDCWGPSHYWRNVLFEDYVQENGKKRESLKPDPYHIYCGPYQNATARFANKWLQVKPGHEELFLLGVGNQLINEASHILSGRPGALGKEYFDVFSKIFADYHPTNVSPLIGISEQNLILVARKLIYATSPLVITGSAVGVDQSPILHMLGFCINLMLGNYNKPGGFYFLPALPEQTEEFASWTSKLANRKTAQPELLFVHECNPLYSLPPQMIDNKMKPSEAFNQIPYKVALAVYENETTTACDLILPISATIERWEQFYNTVGPQLGYFSIQPPAIAPPAQIPSVSAILSAIANHHSDELDFSAPSSSEQKIFEQSSRKLLVSLEEAKNAKKHLVRPHKILDKQIPSGHLLKGILCDKNNLLVDRPQFEGQTSALRLVPLACQEHLNFSMGLSTFRANTLFNKACAGNCAFACLHPTEAKRLGFKPGDKAILKRAGRKMNVLIETDFRICEGAIGLYAGFGHEAGDQFTKEIGQNVFRLFDLAWNERIGVAYYKQTPIELKKIVSFKNGT